MLDRVFAEQSVKAKVDAGFAGGDFMLGGGRLGVPCRGNRVWHVEDGRNAAVSGGGSPTRPILLGWIARVTEMHVDVDGPRENMQSSSIERLPGRRHSLRCTDRQHASIFDGDARCNNGIVGDDVAVMNNKISGHDGHRASSQHSPAAVDREINAGDLARGVAGEKKAGVGYIAVNRYALERVFGRVPLSRFLDADAEALGHIGADLLAEAGAVDHARCYAIDVDVILAHLQRETLGDPA